jgi:hypothetical protein
VLFVCWSGRIVTAAAARTPTPAPRLTFAAPTCQVRDAVTYTEHARRMTVTTMDVVYALKRRGHHLYGFGDAGGGAPVRTPATPPQGASKATERAAAPAFMSPPATRSAAPPPPAAPFVSPAGAGVASAPVAQASGDGSQLLFDAFVQRCSAVLREKGVGGRILVADLRAKLHAQNAPKLTDAQFDSQLKRAADTNAIFLTRSGLVQLFD